MRCLDGKLEVETNQLVVSITREWTGLLNASGSRHWSISAFARVRQLAWRLKRFLEMRTARNSAALPIQKR